MPTLTITYHTEAERIAYEQAVAFVAEMHRLGLHSPARDVIDTCEGLALGQGRKLLNDTLAAAVQARVDDLEKKCRRNPVRPEQRTTAAHPPDGAGLDHVAADLSLGLRRQGDRVRRR
jgi:hypothetical protein